MSYSDIDFWLDEPSFLNSFWNWFDSLPADERRKFDNYPSDMSKIFFYNKVWKNRTK